MGLERLTRLLVKHASYVVQSERLVMLFDGMLARLSDANVKASERVFSLMDVPGGMGWVVGANRFI